jgi:hypothetical protein
MPAYVLRPKRRVGAPKRKVMTRSRTAYVMGSSRLQNPVVIATSQSAPARRLVGGAGRPPINKAFVPALAKAYAFGSVYRTGRTSKWQSQTMSEVDIANRVFNKKFVSQQEALEWFDPQLNPNPSCNPHSLGNYLTINSLARFSATTSTNPATIRIICLQFTPSNLVGWQFSSVKPAILDTNFTPLFASNFNDVPLDINALRMSLSIKNTTINQNVGGLNRWVSLPQSLSYDFPVSTTSNAFTSAFVNQLFSIYDSHPGVVTNTGIKAAEEGLKMVSVPASMVGYNNYYTYTPLTTSDYIPIRTALDAGSDCNSMNTIVLFLPETSSAQSIEATIRANFKCKYPATGTLSTLQKDHNKARTAAWEDVVNKAIAFGQTQVTSDTATSQASGGGTR